GGASAPATGRDATEEPAHSALSRGGGGISFGAGSRRPRLIVGCNWRNPSTRSRYRRRSPGPTGKSPGVRPENPNLPTPLAGFGGSATATREGECRTLTVPSVLS